MDKKVSAGKTAGIIFCILAGICTVVLLFMDVYFSGQMKTIDKFWTSVARDDLNGCKSCLSAELAEKLTEHDFEAEKERFQILLDGENVKTSVTFVDRNKMSDNSYSICVDLTIYNDDANVTERTYYFLVREGMKWLITL